MQTLCTQFTDSYGKNRKLVAQWGKILSDIRDGLTVPSDLAESDDPRGTTFTAICRELGIPRSTAYHYIHTFLITSTYPQWLQDAAPVNGLNLALEHVQNAYEEMRATLPQNPNAFEISGVVAELKKAKATTVDTEPLTVDALKAQFEKMVKRAKKAGIATDVVFRTLEDAIATSFGAPGAKVTRETAPIYRQRQSEQGQSEPEAAEGLVKARQKK